MEAVILVALAFLLGGVLKGAIGAGAPLAAVPALSLIYSVPFAVAVFVAPNVISNLIQIWQYRGHRPRGALVWLFAVAGAAGALTGTFALVSLDGDVLKTGVAVVIGLYLVFRLFRPTAKLALGPATWLSAPVGFVAGILQGASGVSAPVSVTFLSIVRLDRETFIVTIAVFFIAMGVVQAPTLIAMGLLDWRTGGLSLLAVLPLLAGMPLGEAIIRRVSRQWFDRLIMLVLAVMAVMLVVSTQFPASAAIG